jgi:hypothetical protein
MKRLSEDRINRIQVDGEGRLVVEAGAQKRLAAHPGRYRVVPSTGELLILQRVAASPRETSQSGLITGKVALAGEVEATGGLVDVIQFVLNNAWSGQLAFVDGTTRKALYFRRGDVRTAASNLPEDRLGAILYRYGVVGESILNEALKASRGGTKLGQLLVEQGALSAHELYTYVRKQVEEIFYSLLTQRQGAFYVYRADDDSGPSSQLQISTKTLLLDGVRRIDELSYFREKLPTPEVVLVKREPAPSERIGPREQRLLGFVDGVNNLAAIARASHLGEFETTKSLYQLMQSGFVQLRSRRATLDIKAPAPAGRSPAEVAALVLDTYNGVYAKIHAAVAARGKQQVLERGLESFFGSVADFAPLFVGVSIQPDGALPRDQLLANLSFAPTDDKLDYLQRGLNELLFFELFTAGEAVDRREEVELHQKLNEILRDVEDYEVEIEMVRSDGDAA